MWYDKNKGIYTISLDGIFESVPGLLLDQYSISPLLSPDGKFLIYSAYNPAAQVKLPAPNVSNKLFRESIRNPNQIRRLDLETGISDVLLEDLTGGLFYDLLISSDGKKLIYKYVTISANAQIIPQNYKIFDLELKKRSFFRK